MSTKKDNGGHAFPVEYHTYTVAKASYEFADSMLKSRES